MTFKNFLEIAKTKYPNAEFLQHGCSDKNKLSVLVVFNSDNLQAKQYRYNGTYCEVLNKLGIPAVYKKDHESKKASLPRLIEENGTSGFFGEIIDNTEEIVQIKEELLAVQQGKLLLV